MIVSPREKKIAIATSVIVGLMIVYYVVVGPYMDNLALIETNTAAAIKKKSDNDLLFRRESALKKVWISMQGHGLKTNESQADSQLQHAILDWEQLAGVNQQSLKQDQPRKEGDFQVIGYRVTATGSMVNIVRFVWALETAAIPVRVTDLRVTPEKEGTDNLSVQVGVSTLSAPAEAPATPSSAPSTAQSSINAGIGGTGS